MSLGKGQILNVNDGWYCYTVEKWRAINCSQSNGEMRELSPVTFTDPKLAWDIKCTNYAVKFRFPLFWATWIWMHFVLRFMRSVQRQSSRRLLCSVLFGVMDFRCEIWYRKRVNMCCDWKVNKLIIYNAKNTIKYIDNRKMVINGVDRLCIPLNTSTHQAHIRTMSFRSTDSLRNWSSA